MVEKVNVNIKMDIELKSSFEKICEEMGLTLSAAVTIYAKQVVLQGRIPFEITTVKNDCVYDDMLIENRRKDEDSNSKVLLEYLEFMANRKK